MKTIMTALILAGALQPAVARADIKACDELRAEIVSKLEKKGVRGYTLEIVAPADVKDRNMVVGTCDGGARRIIYINKR